MYAFSPGEDTNKEAQRKKENKSHNEEKVHIEAVPGRIERIHIEELGPRVRQAQGQKRKGRKRIYVEGYTRQDVD